MSGMVVRNVALPLGARTSRSAVLPSVRSMHVARERLHAVNLAGFSGRRVGVVSNVREWNGRGNQNPRTLTTATSSFSGSLSTPLKDPSHPDLYYHLVERLNESQSPSAFFALSFLEERPPLDDDSATVLGWLPAWAFSEGGESGLNDFIENPRFLPILHAAVKDALLEDDIWVNGALQTQSGWMHIFDQRNPPALGRIPDPDDIIASVRVEEAKMMPETYQAMPSYRVCAGEGVCMLTDGVMGVLKGRLKEVAKAEEDR